MNKLKTTFSKLTPIHHFLVFLIILTILKIANVFIVDGADSGFHFAGLGVGLIVISSVLHFVFRHFFDKKKQYLNSLISTFLIIVMLSHADPEPIRGILVILLLYVAKHFVKIKGKNIFNPVAFTIGVVTLLAFIVPSLGVPPMDFTGIDIRFPILGKQIPLPLLPITLALIFNVKRIRKYPLALSFIATSLVIGFLLNAYEADLFSYIIIMVFTGAAVVIEPKTSPIKPREQYIYGVALAVLIGLLNFLDLPNAIVIGVLIANLGLYLYRKPKLKV